MFKILYFGPSSCMLNNKISDIVCGGLENKLHKHLLSGLSPKFGYSSNIEQQLHKLRNKIIFMVFRARFQIQTELISSDEVHIVIIAF